MKEKKPYYLHLHLFVLLPVMAFIIKSGAGLVLFGFFISILLTEMTDPANADHPILQRAKSPYHIPLEAATMIGTKEVAALHDCTMPMFPGQSFTNRQVSRSQKVML